MGESHSAYIKDDELAEWVRERVDDGTFRSLGHAHQRGLELLRDEFEGTDDRGVNF